VTSPQIATAKPATQTVTIDQRTRNPTDMGPLPENPYAGRSAPAKLHSPSM
jgi:hypothetical protein